jgi:hypothetical protein
MLPEAGFLERDLKTKKLKWLVCSAPPFMLFSKVDANEMSLYAGLSKDQIQKI